jgi:two-component system, cell cycle response regulator DivK
VADTSPLVLIVEDDPDTRALYRYVLTESGFRTADAHNGFQALDKARELRPDAVVTDLGVPGMDGFEFSRALRESPDTKTIPILAVTGQPDYLREPARVRAAGIDQILTKPCPPDLLVSELRRVLGDAAQDLLTPQP